MPAPMIVPTTMAAESNRPSLRGSSPFEGMSGHDGTAGRLSLHASAAAAFDQGIHFVHRNTAEISRDRVLEAACRDCELQRLGMRGQRRETVDQPAGETVAPADAIHNMGDVV